MMICVFPVPNMKFHIPEYPKLHFANINTNMHLAPIFTRSSLDFWISWCLIKCLFDFDKLIARQFSEHSSNVPNKILKMKLRVQFSLNWTFRRKNKKNRFCSKFKVKKWWLLKWWAKWPWKRHLSWFHRFCVARWFFCKKNPNKKFVLKKFFRKFEVRISPIDTVLTNWNRVSSPKTGSNVQN